MIKVLIVDDDSVARVNIKVMIDWEENGFEICGEAANGEEAIISIATTCPEIIITDVNMPIMGGIALIKHLNQYYPKIIAIALSSYRDFDYVRASMRGGAVDYVLKHTLDAQVLLAVLKTAKEKLIAENSELTKKRLLEAQAHESRTVLRQKFIYQLVQGIINERSEIEKKIEELELDIEKRNLAILLFELDDYNAIIEQFTPKEINRLISSIENICNEILKESVKASVSHIQDGKFIIIFSFDNIRSNMYINNTIITAINRIKSSIKRCLNITACFSYSKVFASITDIRKHFKKAENMLQGRFFKGKDKIVDDLILIKNNEFFNLELAEVKAIIGALKAQSYDKTEIYLNNIFNKFTNNNISYNSIQMVCAELINIVNRVAREIGIDIRLIYNDKEIPYLSIKKFETLIEMRNWIFSLYKRLMSLIGETKYNPKYSEYTRKAIYYIQKNYKENVSLYEAAEHIGVNSSYLSRIFKEDCGIGFVEYLNNTRVSYAKQIIEIGEIKLKDVAKKVGFNNYTYFSKVFKDVLELTPVEYEKRYS